MHGRGDAACADGRWHSGSRGTAPTHRRWASALGRLSSCGRSLRIRGRGGGNIDARARSQRGCTRLPRWADCACPSISSCCAYPAIATEEEQACAAQSLRSTRRRTACPWASACLIPRRVCWCAPSDMRRLCHRPAITTARCALGSHRERMGARHQADVDGAPGSQQRNAMPIARHCNRPPRRAA